MTASKKQAKITKLFRNKKIQLSQECIDLKEEIEQLELQRQLKQNELFQLERNSYICRLAPVKRKSEKFVRPEKIVLKNSIETLKNKIDLMSMLTGMEVQSYCANEHCCVVYHMQHDNQHELKHGLKIDMCSGDNVVSKVSLPLGFNYLAIQDEFDNVMTPEFLGAVRKALMSYYDRQQQFEALKRLLSLDAESFKSLDGSHVEIIFRVQNDEEDEVEVILSLDYRVYDIRPKNISFKELDLPEDVVETLRQQCTVFKRKPLRKAFKQAFITGNGAYKLAERVGSRPESKPKRRNKRFRRNAHNYNNDDTFHPEDCSDSDEADDDQV